MYPIKYKTTNKGFLIMAIAIKFAPDLVLRNFSEYEKKQKKENTPISKKIRRFLPRAFTKSLKF